MAAAARPRLLVPFVLGVAGLAAPVAAHPVTVDGDPSDWSPRHPAENLGQVIRGGTGEGEHAWRDATGDHRKDAPASAAIDIERVRVTGDADNLYFLVQFNASAGAPSYVRQVQIAIDLDRTAGSGQLFLAGWADTTVKAGAAWEFLVQTQFASGGEAVLLDTAFLPVAMLSAVLDDEAGVIEIAVPWGQLGLLGPATALRFTAAAFISASSNDDTLDVGGPTVSNAFDVVTDYADPRTAASGFPNTWSEVMDGVIDFAFDVWFRATGEVYAPIVISRFVYDVVGTEPNAEWVAVTNVSPVMIPLDGWKIGDEETPDQGEGMRRFPTSATLAPGATFIAAVRATDYAARYGEPPHGEFQSTDAAVPDMTGYNSWQTTGGTFNLANAGDDLLLLDGSNTVIDVVGYLTGEAPPFDWGIVRFTTPGATDDERVITRWPVTGDTDDCALDFVSLGRACAGDANCAAGVCAPCVVNACTPAPLGTSCSDGDLCNGLEICDGDGACAAGDALDCDDGNGCTADSCDAALGCEHALQPPGTSCDDGNACNGSETCDAAGTCLAGVDLECDDLNPCTADSCSPSIGCLYTATPAGTSCADGDACNGVETCDGDGACQPGTPPTCTSDNACMGVSCDPSLGCVYTPVAAGTPCSDGDACDGPDACDGGGTCVTVGPAPTCNDGNPCTFDYCEAATGCTTAPVAAGTPCGDGNVCNGVETCDGAGACQADAPPDCDDGNPCTADYCDPAGGCAQAPVPVGVSCSDGDACNGVEACDGAGACAPGVPVECPPDPTPCMVSVCVSSSGACVAAPAPLGSACGDGDPCNGVEACDGDGNCLPDSNAPDAGGCIGDAGPPDAAPGDDAGAAADAGAPDAAAPPPPDAAVQADAMTPVIDDASCGCRVGGRRGAGAGGALALTLLGGALALRRQRRQAR